jgi:hypothetical protein
MKTISIFVFLIFLTPFSLVFAQIAEWESYDVINRLLALQSPSAPVIHGDWAIFTINSDLRRVGVAFAHEDFSNVRWFRQLMIPNNRINPIILPGEREPRPHRDSGIKFYVFRIPDHLRELEYRLVINGLWTVDPLNPLTRRDPVTGLSLSILRLPPRQQRPNPLDGLPAGLRFTFTGPPGESITVAGNFNSWDPFMYELKETSAGVYSLVLPLPPGTYHYVFFHRGQRHVDPHNPNRIYARDGSAASLIVVP